jgi:hypothetical protein
MATFSIYENGKLVDRRYVTDQDEPEQVARIATAQVTLCEVIDARGDKYLVDVEFWDGEHVRWGTDENGIVLPIVVGIEGLVDTIDRMRHERGTA